MLKVGEEKIERGNNCNKNCKHNFIDDPAAYHMQDNGEIHKVYFRECEKCGCLQMMRKNEGKDSLPF